MNVLQDIEYQFESQLGFNVFEYAENGKPIDIIYKQASYKKRKINSNIKKLNSLQSKTAKLDKKLELERSKIEESNTLLEIELTALNNLVGSLNDYIKKTNKISKSFTHSEYKSAKEHISKEQSIVNRARKLFNKNQTYHNKRVKKFQKEIKSYNSLINRQNTLSRRIESLSKGFQEVKGKAIGKDITTTKTYYKDGKKHTEKTYHSQMEKIEIYGFDGDLNQLKAILAHEIAHLVGVEHINESGALMNPLLQERQINNLELTYEDIISFQKDFFK
ncbi:MAG: matrixin family metalloprotease [Helicobacteraceae bacterium]|nr:matrixin family metalloprotease [Helicobacteraceae bacterium]